MYLDEFFRCKKEYLFFSPANDLHFPLRQEFMTTTYFLYSSSSTNYIFFILLFGLVFWIPAPNNYHIHWLHQHSNRRFTLSRQRSCNLHLIIVKLRGIFNTIMEKQKEKKYKAPFGKGKLFGSFHMMLCFQSLPSDPKSFLKQEKCFINR